MPRKKSENNLNNSLDNKNDLENSMSIESFADNEKPKKSASVKKSPEIAAKVELESNDEYTVDPHTGQKYLKPKGTSDVIHYQSFNIPQIKREGYVIIAPIDEKINTIPDLIKQGWEFVDPNTPGCEEAIKAVYAGTRLDGSPMFHKLMQMPESKFKEMEDRKQAALTQKEQDTIYNPTGGDQNMYIGKEFRAPTISRNNTPIRDMDMGMSEALSRAMR
jgi:hypothetical protein